jgi:hypothetical protein
LTLYQQRRTRKGKIDTGLDNDMLAGSQPDADSMEFHMEVVRETAERVYAETVDATPNIQVYGTPSDTVLDMLRRQAGSGVSLKVKPHQVGGFTRAETG